MERILVEVLGAKGVYDSGEATFSLAPERFYRLADVWLATMQGEPLATRSYNHVAFKIADADYDRYLAAIAALDLECRQGRSRVAGEGRSIYFYDYDNHLFELHTGTLDERLKAYRVSRDPAA